MSSERPKAIGDQRGGVAAAVPWWRSVGGRSMGGRWPAGSRGTVVRYSSKVGGRSRDTPTLVHVLPVLEKYLSSRERVGTGTYHTIPVPKLSMHAVP